MTDLIELLNECADALSVPTWDHEHREEHLAYIEEALASRTTPGRAKELLHSAATIFRQQQTMKALSLAVEEAAADGRALATEIESKIRGHLSPFVYHGTIYGRLGGISKAGLVPGKFPVWKDQHVPRHLVDSAVFFDSTWRAAMGWAKWAQMHSRGPLNGIHRSLVVIRLPASGLPLMPDPLANRQGCQMVRGSVSVKDADLLHGNVHGYPKWRPLNDILSLTR